MTNPATEQLAVSQLTVDHEVQRPLDQARVERIAREFHQDALGVLVVNRRADGTIHVIDGQHRCAVARARGIDVVTCLVYSALDLASEAAMFRHLNNTKKPHVIDRFRVRVVEGEKVAVALQDLLHRYGWSVTGGQHNGAFAAISALEALYRSVDAEITERVLHIATTAWGHDANGVRAEIIDGLGAVLARNRGDVNLGKLVRELSKHDGGPLALIGRAKGLREIKGGRVRDCMAEIVVNMHNKGRRTGRIAEWRTDAA